MIEYAVLGGFVLDCLFGDPAWLPHPVVYMGKAISALEKRLRARRQIFHAPFASLRVKAAAATHSRAARRLGR